MSNIAEEDEFDHPCQIYLESESSSNILPCQSHNEHDTQNLYLGPQRLIGSDLHVDPSVIFPTGDMETQPEYPHYDTGYTWSEVWHTYPGATQLAAATDDRDSFEQTYSNVTQHLLPQPPAKLFEEQSAFVVPTDLDIAMNLETDIGHISSSAYQEQDSTVSHPVSQPLGLYDFEEYISYPDNICNMTQDQDSTSFRADNFLPQISSQHVLSPTLNSTDLTAVDQHNELPDAVTLAASQLGQHNVEAGRPVVADTPSWNPKAPFTTQHPQGQPLPFPNQVIAPAFGPSYPVELLPKQKRKRRPMSEQEKRNCAQARRTACWRCKRNKKKCDGKTPCSNCTKILQTARLYKQPCAKAYFSDFCIQNSYFSFSASYQTLVVGKQSEKDLVSHILVSACLFQRDVVFLTRSSFGTSPNCAVSWGQCLALFDKAPEVDLGGLKLNLPTVAQLEKAPEKLLRYFEGPGMYFFALPGQDVDIGKWLNTRIFFSFLGYLTYRGMRNFSIDFPAEVQPQQVRETAMLNIWLSMRQSEIEVFQYLERIVNDDLSSLDSSQIEKVIKAMAVCIIAGSGSARDQSLAFFEDLDKLIPFEFAHDLMDRQERIRSALFVHLSILITTKLPKGTTFWDLFKDVGPIDHIRQEFQQCLDNLELFVSGFKCWEQRLRTDSERFDRNCEVLSNLDPCSYPSLEDQEIDMDEDNQNLFDDEIRDVLRSGEMAILPDLMDLDITGGLLHAISSDSISELNFLIFWPIPTIDWTKAFTPIYHQGTHNVNHHSIRRLSIVYPLMQRVQEVELARAFRARLSETEITMSDFLITLYSAMDDLFPNLTSLVPQLTIETVSEALSRLREGNRWLELIELVGFEEILLAQRLHIGLLASGTPLQRFDIPQIIADGADCDFNRIKFLLTTSFSWITDTCARLNGFVDLFLQCQTLSALGDMVTARILECQLQEKVTKCFGTIDHIQTIEAQLFKRFRDYMTAPLADLRAGLPSDEEIRALYTELEIRPRRANESQAGTEDPAGNALNFKILCVLLKIYVKALD